MGIMENDVFLREARILAVKIRGGTATQADRDRLLVLLALFALGE